MMMNPEDPGDGSSSRGDKLLLFFGISPAFALWLPLLALVFGIGAKSGVAFTLLFGWAMAPTYLVSAIGGRPGNWTQSGVILPGFTGEGLVAALVFWYIVGFLIWLPIHVWAFWWKKLKE